MPRRLLFVLVGIAAAVVGLIPWLITGLRLPLQNLWDDAAATEMPIALLPFSQYYVSLIVAVILVGAAVAGGVARYTRHSMPIAIGVFGTQVAALVQTALTVGGGLQDRSEAGFYLLALVTGTAASILLGIGLFILLSHATAPGVMLAVTVVGIALMTWVNAIVVPVGVVTVSEVGRFLLEYTQWIPAVVVGVTIAVAGVGSFARAIAAVLSLGLLWVGPALVTAITAATGSRILARDIGGMVEYGVQVFGLALTSTGWAPLIPAVAIALVGLLVRAVVRRRTPARVETES